MTAPSEYVGPAEAAVMMSTTPETVARWAREETLKGSVRILTMPNGRRRLNRGDIENYLKEHTK